MRKVQLWLAPVVLAFILPLGAAEPAPVPSDELAALKAQLAAQQQQIQQLQELLRRQGLLLESLQQQLTPKSGSPAVSSGSPEQAAAPRVEELSEQVKAIGEQTSELNAAVGGLEKKVGGLGNFRFSGDLRVRYEPFFQDGAPQRNRERGRLRFEVLADISPELSGGFRLATGGLSDPVSTQQTFTGFFTRKPVDLDRFWLTYKPEGVKGFSVTAGKFAYPWYRTELTFDNDLNPEGFGETLAFNFSGSPLTNVTLVGFQLPFNEVAAGPDSIVWGGQVQTRWKLNERTRMGLYAAGLNFRNADALARAMAAGSVVPSQPLTNSVRVDAGGNVVGFAQRFAYLDLIAELQHDWRPRWPLRLTFDFVNNLRATSGERSGYWAELELGRSQEKGDWVFGYTLIRIEKDAVIGAYNFSDIRAATNVITHRLHAGYQVHKNVVFDYTLFVGRLFNPQDNINLVPAAFQPLAQDPFLKRMQFDVSYKF